MGTHVELTPSDGDRLAGAVWGHLVGDAVGVPYEFRPPVAAEDVRFGAAGSHGQPAGTWSDDGALMLALLDSLLEKGFDTADQAKRAIAWYRNGAYTPDGDGRFDRGNATAAALEAIERGTPAESAGAPDAGGNGSLMRILPLALVERDLSTHDLVDHAQRASSVTHGHPVATVCCALYVLVARNLLAGTDGRAASLSKARSALRGLYETDARWHGLLPALDTLEQYTERGGRGRAWDSFWSAWDAFAGADSYEDTIRRAVAYGDDTDTTACIAGGLAGVYWGIDGIPREWLAGMRGKEFVWPLLARLLTGAGYRTGELRVNWVDLSSVPTLGEASGRLGMTFLPGRRGKGNAGDHWRDVEADASHLRASHGVDTMLLLVEDDELDKAHVHDLAGAMSRHGMKLLRHPIADCGIPADLAAFRETLTDVERRLLEGNTVVVACMGGLGRTGITVACLLRSTGLGAEAAMQLARSTRHGAVDPGAQEEFVRRCQ